MLLLKIILLLVTKFKLVSYNVNCRLRIVVRLFEADNLIRNYTKKNDDFRFQSKLCFKLLKTDKCCKSVFIIKKLVFRRNR